MRPAAAIDYLERKGFAVTWNWHDIDAATHARAFTVARAARLDVLQDIRDALAQNLEKGQTVRDFARNLRPVLEGKGWWGRQMVASPDGDIEVAQLGSPRRLETIYQTNLQAAYMGGRAAAYLEATDTHPYWMYLAVLDGVTRPAHAALHGKVFRWDDPIWQHILPPNGYNCRCRIVALSADEVQRRGLVVESSAGKTRTVSVETGVDKRTGEIREQEVTQLETTDRAGKRILFRPDAGFDGSPIQSHLTDQVLEQKAIRTLGSQAAFDEVQSVLLDPVRQRAWLAFLDQAAARAQGQTMTFGILPPDVVAFVSGQGEPLRDGLAWLMDRSARAADLPPAGLVDLPSRFANPRSVLWDNQKRALLVVIEDAGDNLVARLNQAAGGQAELTTLTPAELNAGLASGQYRRVR